MNRTLASLLMVILFGTLGLLVKIPTAKASFTICVRADGSVDPPTVPITTVDNVTYTFTNGVDGSVCVERNHVIIDGNGNGIHGSWQTISSDHQHC